MTKPIDESCEDCRFEVEGTCRFNPPQFGQDAAAGASHSAMWPPVPPGGWCGRFKPGAIAAKKDNDEAQHKRGR